MENPTPIKGISICKDREAHTCEKLVKQFLCFKYPVFICIIFYFKENTVTSFKNISIDFISVCM